MNQAPGTVTRADLWRVVARSFLLQALWNRERMQGQGLAYALRPVARRLAGASGEAGWLARHLGFFNTQPAFASYALGVVARLEAERARAEGPPEETIEQAKSTLGPALAAVGDSLIWSSIRPPTAVIGALWALEGSPYGALVFLFLYNSFHLLVRVRGVFAGWRLGLKFWDEEMRARLRHTRLVVCLAGTLAGFALVDVLANRLVGGHPTSGIWLVVGLAIGLAWGEGRRVSAAALGIGLFAVALAWATWVP